MLRRTTENKPNGKLTLLNELNDCGDVSPTAEDRFPDGNPGESSLTSGSARSQSRKNGFHIKTF